MMANNFKNKTSSVHLSQLDGLRAIAILLVFVEHFSGGWIRENFPIGAGTMGVRIFFVLSGFLITSILLDAFHGNQATDQRDMSLRNFYIRRFLRLMPLYFVVLGILVALNIESFRPDWLWHVTYLSNMLVAYGGQSSVFWSLAVEEQFYLFWPLVLVITPRASLVPVAISLIIIGAGSKIAFHFAGFDSKAVGYFLTSNLETLGAGSLLAILCFSERPYDFSKITPSQRKLFLLLAVVAFAAAVVLWWTLGKRSLARHFINDAFLAVSFAWLVFAAARGFSGPIGALLNAAPMRHLGKISYCAYLIHSFIPDILRLPSVQAVTGPLSFGVSAVLTLVLTILIPTLSWRYFEGPINDMKRHFPMRYTYA